MRRSFASSSSRDTKSVSALLVLRVNGGDGSNDATTKFRFSLLFVLARTDTVHVYTTSIDYECTSVIVRRACGCCSRERVAAMPARVERTRGSAVATGGCTRCERCERLRERIPRLLCSSSLQPRLVTTALTLDRPLTKPCSDPLRQGREISLGGRGAARAASRAVRRRRSRVRGA
jgi:hypothetical protein